VRFGLGPKCGIPAPERAFPFLVEHPRPERPEFVTALKKQIPFCSQRHSVKPGLTDRAQIDYKHGNTFEDAARELECYPCCIKNVSPWLDFYIMLRTAWAMLTGQGAQ
jgi:lipopolysaccharide/colanic/teichoic acid biosynthesis glycosyltransferase